VSCIFVVVNRRPMGCHKIHCPSLAASARTKSIYSYVHKSLIILVSTDLFRE